MGNMKNTINNANNTTNQTANDSAGRNANTDKNYSTNSTKSSSNPTKNHVDQWIEKVFKLSASLQLAVFVIIALGVISAVGTIYESMYDRVYAQKLIYHSVWMWAILSLLAINITAVLVDRWPWKKHHASFVLAHIGILFLLAGSVVTYFYGIDGSMVCDIGQNCRVVQVQEDEFNIFTSMDGQSYRPVHQEAVDFFHDNLKKNPKVINFIGNDIKIYDYIPFGLAQEKFVEAQEKTDTPAVQFLIEGVRANQTAWLFKDKAKLYDKFQMGPANFTLATEDYQRAGGNELIFKVKNDELHYEIYSESKQTPNTKGIWKRGDVISTGWMDFKVRVLNFYPQAAREITFLPQEKPSERTTPVIKVSYKGKDYEVGHNRPLRLFESDKVHVLSYGSRQYDIGFDMMVTDFRVGRYEGTRRAASYESTVKVQDESEPIIISMNEPMKKAGLTFYQSSFFEDPETGLPIQSIFSVNKDPGRFTKYFGSALIFLGIFMLFYFRDTYAEKYKSRFAQQNKKRV